MKSLKLVLAISIAIGIVDDLGFVFNLELLSSGGGFWMAAAALSCAATFFFATQCLHWRALWLLVGVALPFVGAVIGAGMI